MQPSRVTRRFSLEGHCHEIASFGLALLSAIAIVASAPAQAQNGSLTRSFVLSAGADTNPCTITQPCASFAHAYTAVGANGIVAALDPGKYGPLAITGPVTINGNGWAAITGTAQGAGITINAGSGDVTLNGLEIDGAGAAYNGIVFNTGSSLIVTNCTAQKFVYAGTGSTTGNGIFIAPTNAGTISFAITNTIVSDNGTAGIAYQPPSGSTAENGVIDHVAAINNFDGILIATQSSGGATTIAISNSVAGNNAQDGIYLQNGSANLTVLIDNTGVSGSTTGIDAENTTKVLLGRSAITGNGTGVENNTSQNSFYSYQDNRINGNGTDITTALNRSFALE
jgi:hypothetical protein